MIKALVERQIKMGMESDTDIGALLTKEMFITGTQVNYFMVCKTKLWLFTHFVTMEQSSDLVAYGKLVHEMSYGEKKKEIIIDRPETDRISKLMAIEGAIRNIYYQSYDKIFPQRFRLESRTKQPPDNPLNALISFGNSLLYGTVLTEIYNTQLNPTISYLHEPSERRFSLSLDMAEIFKPFIVDRVIFKLVNKQMLSDSDFVKELNSCLLNEKGRRTFLAEWDNKLKTTIKHRELKRNVSYQRLIRLECYKLTKHLLGMKRYKPFVMWW